MEIQRNNQEILGSKHLWKPKGLHTSLNQPKLTPLTMHFLASFDKYLLVFSLFSDFEFSWKSLFFSNFDQVCWISTSSWSEYFFPIFRFFLGEELVFQEKNRNFDNLASKRHLHFLTSPSKVRGGVSDGRMIMTSTFPPMTSTYPPMTSTFPAMTST